MPPESHHGIDDQTVVLREVTAEVAAMEEQDLRGPPSFVARRLAARGIRVSVATLRSEPYRRILKGVRRRARKSVRSYGPTAGYDLRPKDELVDLVIDLKCRIGRVRCDIAGTVYERSGDVKRDSRSLAACAFHAADVQKMARLIEDMLPKMAERGIMPTYKTVSVALEEDGHSLDHRSIRRREEYWRPIREFRNDAPVSKVSDPERDRLNRLPKEELGATVVVLKSELKILDAQFEATLSG